MEEEKTPPALGESGGKAMSFWDHLEDLRGTIFRIAIGIVVCMIFIFANKGLVFDTILFGPRSSDFIVYRGMCALAEFFSFPALCPDPFKIELINTTTSGQFFTHISTSFWLGFVVSLPWIIYQLWLFVAPALFPNEKHHVKKAFFASSFLFFIGVLVSYYIVFPITIKFLGTYQVSAEAGTVPNLITLSSYIDTLVLLCLCMGLVFELPILLFLLSKMGLVTKAFLREYRRYAIVIILIIAAVITPTADPFTMIVVSIPILLLYEVGIKVCVK